MAYYAALASLVQLLDDIVLGDRYPTFLLGKHQVIRSLCEKFTLLEESLQDYSSKGDKANDRVEGRIRDVAYQAQDAIEFEILNHVSSQERTGLVKMIGQYQQERSKKKYVKTLGMVEKELDLVLEEMMSIKEKQRGEGSELNWDSPAISAAPSTKHIMVGHEEGLIIIKDQLCGQSSQLKVIPIVGMGGIGKTTLARKAFDDALVAYHFDLRAWVTVSQEYHENAVLQSIAKSLGLAKERDLKEFIYKDLKGRRYLIVVDDIWGTEVLDDVRRIFPDDRNGSRIMLTTRLLDVARYANPAGFVHEMRFLNEQESWNLLQKKVFEKECCPPELEEIGMFIANKCYGLPLAVIVIAGILSHSKTLPHWENIAGKVRTMLGITDEHINRILSLSYNHLSHQLKPCFLYLGSFPEDYEINIPNLIRLWIADGFLKSNDSSKLVEKVGEECIEDLVKRNLVLITKKRPNGQFKICILHDVVREFCRQRAFDECFFHVMDVKGHLNLEGNEKVRRINYYGDPDNRETYYGFGCHMHNNGKLTRSFNFLTDRFNVGNDLFRQDDVKLLRVFNSSQSYSRGIPDAFFPHFFLKYLSFVTYNLRDSVFMLQNLQTLILDSIEFGNVMLPREIWQMTQLRHLIIYRMTLPSIPVGVQKLECLQTLMRVEDCKFPDELIQMIPNLRKLKASSKKGKITDANCLMNLVHLPHLEELKILGYRSTCNISFPLSLKELSLYNCDIRWKDMKMVGSLPNLQVLKLRMTYGGDTFPGDEVAEEEGEEWEPIEGDFQRLKFLQFRHLKLRYWRADDTHFPCLEYLSIRNCEALEMIPEEIGDIPTLKVIHIFNSYAARYSAYQIQEDQRNKGNDELQVFDDAPPRGTYMELSHPRRPY